MHRFLLVALLAGLAPAIALGACSSGEGQVTTSCGNDGEHGIGDGCPPPSAGAGGAPSTSSSTASSSGGGGHGGALATSSSTSVASSNIATTGSGPPLCTPGEQITCGCVGDPTGGVQVCQGDGTFGECTCSDGGADGDAGPEGGGLYFCGDGGYPWDPAGDDAGPDGSPCRTCAEALANGASGKPGVCAGESGNAWSRLYGCACIEGPCAAVCVADPLCLLTGAPPSGECAACLHADGETGCGCARAECETK